MGNPGLVFEIDDRLDFVHSANFVRPFIIDRSRGLNEWLSVGIGDFHAPVLQLAQQFLVSLDIEVSLEGGDFSSRIATILAFR